MVIKRCKEVLDKEDKGIEQENSVKDTDILSEGKGSVLGFCQEEAQTEEGNTEGSEADVAVCQKES